MTLDHIKDQIENYGYIVALEAYQLGMEHARGLFMKDEHLPDGDDLKNQLRQVATTKLQGTK
jgi:hypothetical protein